MARMGKGEPLVLDDELVVEDDVEIERARTPAHLAHPAPLALDRQQSVEQVEGRQLRLDEHDHVEVRPLVVRTAHGICLEDLRLGDEVPEVPVGEARDPVAQMGDAVAEIRPECHGDPAHPSCLSGADRYASTMVERVTYDEFGLFHENATEYGLPFDAPPTVTREHVEVSGGRNMSALRWGSASPRIVFLHGGAQNAHTWDTVALALDLPVLCIDLPGHGHSDSAAPLLSGAGPLEQNAADMANIIERLAPRADAVVGMSLGGLTSLALAEHHPSLVRRLVLVDITPGVNSEKTKQITDFVNGPATFPSFDELLARTIQFNPGRSESSLRRGILHNALQLDDGSWVWRYRRPDAPPLSEADGTRPPTSALWETVSGFDKPMMFVRGMRPQSVVGDDDEAELRRRAPHVRVEHVAEAGHSVQGDRPLELAAMIADFLGA